MRSEWWLKWHSATKYKAYMATLHTEEERDNRDMDMEIEARPVRSCAEGRRIAKQMLPDALDGCVELSCCRYDGRCMIPSLLSKKPSPAWNAR